MSDPNLMIDKIREEHKKGLPSKRKILSYLLDLLNKDKYPSLSDIEFYSIVGETYKLNLDYKLNLELLFYPVYKVLKKKIKKLYGDEKSLEMEKYLMKNFNLFGVKYVLTPMSNESPDENPGKNYDEIYDEILDEISIKRTKRPNASSGLGCGCYCVMCFGPIMVLLILYFLIILI